MMQTGKGYRVAVRGSSSLMGRELLAVLEERKFPVGNLLKLDEVPDDPENPMPEDAESFTGSPANQDFIFIAGNAGQDIDLYQDALDESRITGNDGPIMIGLTGGGDDAGEGTLSIAHLDPAAAAADSRIFTAPHSAAIVLSTLLLRLGARFPIERSVATIFASASEAGPEAIEELHKQTANLMSFQKLPKEIFGAQLAFNLLPHLNRAANPETEALEARVRSELNRYLDERVETPALTLLRVPVFYSLAVSLYVETASTVAPEAVEQALAGKPIRFRQAGDEAPSPVRAAGSSEILVDKVRPDASCSNGIWIWAVTDNLRLAAENAVAIAERAVTGKNA